MTAREYRQAGAIASLARDLAASDQDAALEVIITLAPSAIIADGALDRLAAMLAGPESYTARPDSTALTPEHAYSRTHAARIDAARGPAPIPPRFSAVTPPGVMADEWARYQARYRAWENIGILVHDLPTPSCLET